MCRAQARPGGSWRRARLLRRPWVPSEAMRRTVPRRTLKGLVKRHKPHLRLAANTDLLVHLNFLLFLHRLAEETRTQAIAGKSKTIKYEHVLSSAKIILKKSRG